jgi:CheY-like chemotaxis protein
MAHSEMVMMKIPDDSPFQYNLEKIFKAGERARDMVKQILAFGRQKPQERAPVKLDSILQEVLKLIRSSIPTTIDIRHTVNTKNTTIVAESTLIHQVILNLCTNASQAMREEGGVLELTIDEVSIDSETIIQFDKLASGAYLKLTVKDTGRGIEHDIIDRIFEPYFTTKDVGEGSGMGLAVTHGIVKSHGGDIKVESEPGKGSAFYVLLPKSTKEIIPEKENKKEIPGGTEHILFIDDEETSVDTFQAMLEYLGYDVTAMTDSIEAVKMFRGNPEMFDLVITDMTMPNMTGKSLAKEMMVIRPEIPVILYTGFSEQIDENSAREMGIKAYLMKPIVMHDLAKTVREVLDGKTT